MAKNNVEDPAELLNGISDFFVRDISSIEHEEEEYNVQTLLEQDPTRKSWQVLTSSLLNKFNPRNIIFKQELEKKRLKDEADLRL